MSDATPSRPVPLDYPAPAPSHHLRLARVIATLSCIVAPLQFLSTLGSLAAYSSTATPANQQWVPVAIAFGAAWVGLDIMLFLAAIQTLAGRAAGRRLFLMYAWGALPIAAASLVINLSAIWPQTSGSAVARLLSTLAYAAPSATLNAMYLPLILLTVFHRLWPSAIIRPAESSRSTH